MSWRAAMSASATGRVSPAVAASLALPAKSAIAITA